jgi:GT2 family glycosyltransferase
VELTCARRGPRLFDALVQSVGLGPVLTGTRFDTATFPRASYTREHDVPCLSGAAMLVRASALDAVGGVDDRFFMYFEDIDTCERLRRGGYRLRFCPQARVFHTGAASSPRDPALEIWLHTEDAAAVNLFFRVHRGRLAAGVHRGLVALGALIRIVVRRLLPGWDRFPASGTARLRWALTGRMPAGGPNSRPNVTGGPLRPPTGAAPGARSRT